MKYAKRTKRKYAMGYTQARKRGASASADLPEGHAKHAGMGYPSGSFARAVRAVTMASSETKFHIKAVTESTVYGTTFTSPTNYTYLNEITEGITENQRIGNIISPTFINVRGSVKVNTRVPCYTKLFVVSHDISADPRADLLEGDSGVLDPNSLDLAAIYARINVQKYRVLATKVVKTGSYGANDDDYGAAELFNMNIPMSGKMEYTDGAVMPNKRTISFFAISRQADNDPSSGSVVEVTMNSKFYYKDM